MDDAVADAEEAGKTQTPTTATPGEEAGTKNPAAPATERAFVTLNNGTKLYLSTPEEVQKKLKGAAKRVKAQIAALEEAKKVSQATMQMVVGPGYRGGRWDRPIAPPGPKTKGPRMSEAKQDEVVEVVAVVEPDPEDVGHNIDPNFDHGGEG